MSDTVSQIYYRASDLHTLDAYNNISSCIIYEEFFKVKDTPRGMWVASIRIRGVWPNEEIPKQYLHWIGHAHHKKYVYDTKFQALVALRARKKRQIEILRWKLECAEAGFKLASDTLITAEHSGEIKKRCPISNSSDQRLISSKASGISASLL